MTRRIATAILATVWTMLALGGGSAYWGVREMLLADLDETLAARAFSVPGATRPGSSASVTLPPTDRYIVRDAAGRTLARPPTSAQGQAATFILSKRFASLPEAGKVRSVTVQVVPANGMESYTVVYSGTAVRFDQTMNRLAMILLGVGVASGLATTVVAVAVSRRVVRPLHRAAAVIGSIDEGKLDRRIDDAVLPPEVRPIAQRLNEMLERLELVFAQRRQFLADAAHELRTPVAALLTTLEVSARRPRAAEAIAQTLQSCLADARLLKRLTDTLLEQARTESPAPGALELIDVAALARQCVDALRPVADAKNIEVGIDLPVKLPFRTRTLALQSILMNLLSNAIEYTPEGGHVGLTCGIEASGELRLEVADSGAGIRPEDLPHLFEPFYRGDAARKHQEGHLGLGLFLVRSHVAALGGRWQAGNRSGNEVSSGAVFVITLPPDEVNLARPEVSRDKGVAADPDLAAPANPELLAPMQGGRD